MKYFSLNNFSLRTLYQYDGGEREREREIEIEIFALLTIIIIIKLSNWEENNYNK